MSTIFVGERWSIQRFVSGFANNAFLVTCARTGNSVIVDTPADPHDLIAAASLTTVGAVLITHGHQDHLEGFATVIGEFAVPVGIGTADRDSLRRQDQRGLELIDFSAGRAVEVGDISLQPMTTPGHTPGSTCFLLEGSPAPENPAGPEDTGSHVFTGDTLFPGGPGKSANNQALKQMIASIETHIFTLPDSTFVLPGHGEFTTVGESRQDYAVFASRPFNSNLSGDITWA